MGPAGTDPCSGSLSRRFAASRNPINENPPGRETADPCNPPPAAHRPATGRRNTTAAAWPPRAVHDEVLPHIWPTHHENVHFCGTNSVDLDGELARLGGSCGVPSTTPARRLAGPRPGGDVPVRGGVPAGTTRPLHPHPRQRATRACRLHARRRRRPPTRSTRHRPIPTRSPPGGAPRPPPAPGRPTAYCTTLSASSHAEQHHEPALDRHRADQTSYFDLPHPQ